MTLLNKINLSLNLNSKKASKITAALILSLGGAISSMSAIAMATDNTELRTEVREISIEAEHGKEVKLFVHDNGEMVNVIIPHTALSDKEQLSSYLVDVPDGVKEKLLKELTSLSDNVHISANHDSGGEVMRWVSEGESEKVIIIERDGDESVDIEIHIVKEMMADGHHKIFKFEHGSEMGAKGIIKMLQYGDYSAEELNKIQQALDSKR